MDNAFVRSSSDYCELKLPHYEDGFYVIVTVETFNEDELESKMEQLDEICSACPNHQFLTDEENPREKKEICEAQEKVFRYDHGVLEA